MTALTDKIYNDIQVATTIDQADLADILTTLALSEHTVSEIADFTLASTVADALTAIGLGTADTPTFAGLNLSSLTVDTSTLVVDGTNNYVGIGTATPATGLDVALAASFGSTVALTGATSLTATLSTSGSGKIVLGTTSAQTVGALAGAEDLAVNGLGNRAGISVARWSNDTSGSRLTLFHGRGTSVGTYTSLVNGDTLGGVYFAGANGSTYLEGGYVRALTDGTPGSSDMSSAIAIGTTSGTTLSEKMRVSSSGRVYLGHTATVTTQSTDPNLQVNGNGGIGAYRWVGDTTGPFLFLTKSRNTTTGTYGTIVQSGDDLGSIFFCGDDGSASRAGARIRVQVDGTPGSLDMPGRLSFMTSPDGSATPVERMRIDSTGLVTFGDTDTGLFGYGLSDVLAVYTSGTERMRWTNTATLFGGTTAAATLSTVPTVQTHGAGGIGAFRWSADANPAFLFLTKSRGTTAGTFGTIVQSGDSLGAIYFAADDGSSGGGVAAAAIVAVVDGTPGLTDMPTYLSLRTSTDGTATLSEGIRLTNAGAVYLPRISTTASAANAYIDNSTSNSILRSTSSIRYKKDVQPLTMEEARKLLNLAPVTYRSRAEADDPDRRWFGFIAEDVAEVESRLVNFGRIDADGPLVPDGVQYDRTVVLSTLLIKDHEARIAALETRLAALEAA